MASSCSEQRLALLECLADSKCIQEGRPIKECMNLSSEESGCSELRVAFYDCKRGQVHVPLLHSCNQLAGAASPCHADMLSHATHAFSLTCARGSKGISQIQGPRQRKALTPRINRAPRRLSSLCQDSACELVTSASGSASWSPALRPAV
jgi:hypothetical protein